jgi:uncharacterized integral membrane protein (TIGR00698 family)
LLKISVVGLGFGMNMFSAFRAGEDSFLFTVASITITISLGLLIGKYFGIDKKISQLISCGTAICGGSAISAISPIIKADNKQISISIGIVFLLNSIALFIFPPIGHLLELSQHQFGVWSAIAIHDTSSVVGAAEIYGDKALEVATTVKLARALWIIPVSILFAVFSKAGINKVRVPYFIGLFILAIIANTYIPSLKEFSPYIVIAAKTGLTLTLFLIGSGLTFKSLRDVGAKPILLAVFLWVFISISSLMIIVKTFV